MSDGLDNIRRDIARLSSDLSKGLSATSVLLSQLEKRLDQLDRRVNEKAQNDHKDAVELAATLAEIRTTLAGLQKREEREVTGQHNLAKDLVAANEKREDRESDERKAKLQFWGAILAVAAPGLVALIWRLFDLPGEPPTPPSGH